MIYLFEEIEIEIDPIHSFHSINKSLEMVWSGTLSSRSQLYILLKANDKCHSMSINFH